VERGLPHIFFRHKYLIVARITIQEANHLVTGRVINQQISNGFSSFGVARLRFLKSTHIHIFPVFFFSTGTVLETKSA
jgi:hypothetical protein